MHRRYLSHSVKIKKNKALNEKIMRNLGENHKGINIGFDKKIAEKYQIFEDFQREMEVYMYKFLTKRIIII